MLSFHAKFVQTYVDRQMDSKTICPQSFDVRTTN